MRDAFMAGDCRNQAPADAASCTIAKAHFGSRRWA
jgi:hypothetical protein